MTIVLETVHHVLTCDHRPYWSATTNLIWITIRVVDCGRSQMHSICSYQNLSMWHIRIHVPFKSTFAIEL